MKVVVRGLLTVLTIVVSLGLAGVPPAIAQREHSVILTLPLAAVGIV